MKKVCAVLLAAGLLFTQSISTSAAFKDVSKSYWANEEIVYLTNKKIISGFKDQSFQPNAPVTKIQAMIMTARALNLDLTNRPAPGFNDLPKSSSGYAEAAAVVDEGLFPKSTTLKPAEPITRAQMARMLTAAFKWKASDAVSFKDVPRSFWGHPYITALASQNITLGYPDGTFKPNQALTRSQFSVFLARALNDDYKTYTYTNTALKYKLELPNYMKTQVTTENKKDKIGSYGTYFYYNNAAYLGHKPILAIIWAVPESKLPRYEGAPFELLKKQGSTYYFYQGPSEHPYLFMDNQNRVVDKRNTNEAKAYERIQYKLAHMIKGITPTN
ncbi:S-layer homology domain-containing protein [Domibacillus sp.]|uniref:S-layer homology domain-containing protein n=1 Tax=Domibacillus sp. TaxID=1969783 RepID=UPI0028120A81|nr:S-layer homology domain-containing protein [Domibacillus sp.]